MQWATNQPTPVLRDRHYHSLSSCLIDRYFRLLKYDTVLLLSELERSRLSALYTLCRIGRLWHLELQEPKIKVDNTVVRLWCGWLPSACLPLLTRNRLLVTTFTSLPNYSPVPPALHISILARGGMSLSGRAGGGRSGPEHWALVTPDTGQVLPSSGGEGL